jgi:hypothetical protein
VQLRFWGWISYKEAEILSRVEQHPDGLQHKHILKCVMVPPIRVLHPEAVIQFQQDYTCIHDSTLAQEWPSRLADV